MASHTCPWVHIKKGGGENLNSWYVGEEGSRRGKENTAQASVKFGKKEKVWKVEIPYCSFGQFLSGSILCHMVPTCSDILV